MTSQYPTATGDKLMQSAPGLQRGEAIEIVTVAFLRFLERNRTVSCSEVADRVAGGSRETVSRLLSREVPSLALAQRIIDAYPEIGLEIGEPVVCNRCGRLPHFPRGKPLVTILSTDRVDTICGS